MEQDPALDNYAAIEICIKSILLLKPAHDDNQFEKQITNQMKL